MSNWTQMNANLGAKRRTPPAHAVMPVPPPLPLPAGTHDVRLSYRTCRLGLPGPPGSLLSGRNRTISLKALRFRTSLFVPNPTVLAKSYFPIHADR